MGRSVMTLPSATTVAYQRFNPDHYCNECGEFGCQHEPIECEFGCDHSEEFQDLLGWIAERASELWPSMHRTDRWVGNELHVIAENAHSIIAVSEYCDLVSISLGSNYDRDTYWRDPEPGLGEHWRKQISDRFDKEFGELAKLGTFSNGESLYSKIGA